jgi:cytidine deaminase
MTKTISELFEKAREAGENAYAPYSKYQVGAALKTDTGRIFSGCNAETANYKGTCAEAGAIAAMVAAGERRIAEIVVVGPANDLCTPCGDCRQRIREFSDAATRIHAVSNDGKTSKQYTMDELLPDSFGPHNLQAARLQNG